MLFKGNDIFFMEQPRPEGPGCSAINIQVAVVACGVNYHYIKRQFGLCSSKCHVDRAVS